MDQAHTRALSALQPFIHLALTTASPTPRFLADLVTRAISAPNTYVFAELLQTPAIQSLRSTETPEQYRSYLTLLEIYAWGTWEEYQSTPNLPPLNEQQAHKLRLLSLLSLATTPNQSFTYTFLQISLSLSTPLALETLITSAIYASLVTARLSPTTTPPVVHITSIAPLRDLRPNSIPTMIKILSEWEGRCDSVIRGIESEILKIRNKAAARRAKEKERKTLVEKAVKGGQSGDGPKDGEGDSKGTKKGEKSPERSMKGRGVGGMGGNKRDLNSVDDDEDGSDEGVDVGVARMEVDEGLGGKTAGGGGRNAKRVLGLGKKGL